MAQQQSMFGPTPEELQMALMQQQQANNWKQGMDWGSRDLGQQISAASFMGGQGIGQGIGQLGQAAGFIPEDPRLAEARRLMQIKQEMADANIDPSDIDKFYPEMIRRLNAAGFPEQANRAMQQYTQAQTAQGNLEARKAEAEARRLKALQDKKEEAMPGLAIYKRLGGMPDKYDPIVLEQFKKTITPDNPLGDAGILKDAPIDKPEKYDVSKETDDGRVVYVDKLGKEAPWYFNEQGVQTPLGSKKIRDRSTKATATTTVERSRDTVAFRKQLLTETAPYDEMLRSTGVALGLGAKASIDNPTATQAFRNALARAFRSDGQVAQAEVNRLISAGDLPTRIADGFLQFFNGTITPTSIKNAKETLQAMRVFAAKQRKKVEKQARDQLSETFTEKELKYITSGGEVDPEDIINVAPTQGQSTAPYTLTPDDEDLIKQNLNRPPQGTR